MANDFAVPRAQAMRAAFVLFALVAGSAAAQTLPSNPPIGPNGAMSFPNVRVIQATPGMTRTDLAAPARPGFRAYIDPATGALAEPGQEDVAALEAAMPADQKKPPRKALSILRGPNGAVGVRLDGYSMVYSIVRRTEDGRLEEVSVPGETLAERLLRTNSEPKTGSAQ